MQADFRRLTSRLVSDSSDEGKHTHHRAVLYHEIIHALRPRDKGFYLDGTVGAGGHAAGILEACSPNGMLLGLDVDPQAIEIAKERLAEFGERAIVLRGSYVTLPQQLESLGWQQLDGALLDLGASSMQFDRPERGFSFQKDGALDMRFDMSRQTTAAELVNHLPAAELADVIYRYGEEKRSRKIARAIVEARPLESTHQLAKVVSSVVKRKPGGIHPATRTFQALRIAVNDELAAIEQVLPQIRDALKSGGRMAIISFHSLEDRLVKRFFREQSSEVRRQPDDLPDMVERNATLKLITRKPERAGNPEIEANPRSRSAKLRVAEKI